MLDDVEIHYAEEWAALYIDGILVTVGDAYVAEQKIFELFGVTVVQDDAFLRGQTSRNGVAANTQEVEAYRQEREENKAKAERLRERATKLLDEARELERLK